MLQISVEEIMQGIREDIESKGYDSDIPSFQDVTGTYDKGHSYNYKQLMETIYQINVSYNVKWFRELPGNFFVVFIKRAIRWLVSFLVAPMSEEQNLFNRSAAKAINQLLGYIDEQSCKIEEMETKMKLLEEKVAYINEDGGK